MTRFFIIPILLLGTTLSSCLNIFNCVDGEGIIIQEEFVGFSASNFSTSISGDIHFVKSNEVKVVVETYENLFKELELKEESDFLKVNFRSCIDYDTPPMVTIYYTDLNAIKINGGGTISFSDTVNTDNFELKINGSGDINLPIIARTLELKINGSGDVKMGGQVENAEIKINGSGDIMAKELITLKSEIGINGSGDVEITVKEDLNTSITGSGDITYFGNPATIHSKNVGSGTVTHGKE
ncbi:head GIN domain-containing protein [Luteibaculum oceani]|uniref:DUF2807 domain-containing protein n=1 Tax=Luteibaculum oceani TaxID=1294296 RepID=A0A5C6V1D3_9FLAO|nr:head GIN domain-containing protein [Luteibaculum oceani]TXC78471.1 DUF2807 domain-containing protein [Luteibaculum oceani]